MSQINISENETIEEIIEKIKQDSDSDISLNFDELTIIVNNPLNLEIIKELSKLSGKNIIVTAVDGVKDQKGEVQKTSRIAPWRFLPRTSRLVLFIFFLLFLLTAVAGAAYYFLPSAKVTISVEKNYLNKTFDIHLKEDSVNIDIGGSILPIKLIKVEEKSQASYKTTGQKITGTKAAGKITLQNKTDSDLDFQAGTLVKSESTSQVGPLTFVLNSEVVLPKQSIKSTLDEQGFPTGTTTIYGTATADITATDVGEQYNLVVGTTFSIGDKPFSQVSVFAASNFTGGSTQKITIFSSQDEKADLADLSKKLFDQGISDLNSKLIGDQKVLEKTITQEISASSFDKQLGSEVASITANVTTTTQAYVYSDSQLKDLVSSLVTSSIPQGSVLFRDGGMNFGEIILSKTKDQNGGFSSSIQAQMVVVPDIDTTKLLGEIGGRSPQNLETILGQTKGVLKYTLELWPHFPSRIARLPFNQKKITIVIAPQ